MATLPPFPTQSLLNKPILQTIESTLRRSSTSSIEVDTETYIATFAKQRAYSILNSGVNSTFPEAISRLTLFIAQRTTRPIEIHTLIDLSIIYAHSYPTQLHLLFQAQYSLFPAQLIQSVTDQVLPTFITLLTSSDTYQELVSKRKISESILCFLRACSPIHALIQPFTLSKDFILALASLYDTGLTSIAASYGGPDVLLSQSTDILDDWPRLWVQTKVALIDAFHVLLSALIDDLSSPPPTEELEKKERIFDTLFSLFDLGVPQHTTTPQTPFLNLPLIADYQHAYNFSEKLFSILKPTNTPSDAAVSERDPRFDLLEKQLAACLTGIERKNPGVLNIIILRSSGNTSTVISDLAGPSTSKEEFEEDPISLEPKTAQILAILPHLSRGYVTRLLRDDRFGGDVERVLEGLLDGSLVSEDPNEREEHIGGSSGKGKQRASVEARCTVGYDVSQRKNLFDDEELDVTRLRVGKQDIGSDLLQDKNAIERMKRDILRRVEEMDEAEAEWFEDEEEVYSTTKDRAKASKILSDAFDEDEIELELGASKIRLPGSGASDADSAGSSATSDSESDPKVDPETLIEQAYFHDPTVFNRDANTRRGKARIELRRLTGWADEQIEGWKIMLDRTPGKKARLDDKLAFSGNVKGLTVPGSVSRSGYGGHRGRGKKPTKTTTEGNSGRGGGGGGGGESSRGSKRGGRGGGRGGNVNHRKRGHDRKIARVGGIA